MRLFSTDIDGTIFDGPLSATQFLDFWNSLKKGGSEALLVYNTGRALDDTLALLEATDLPKPDFLICGVGTQIFCTSKQRISEEWHRLLSEDWDFELVREVVGRLSPAEPQPQAAQNAHKCSWYWKDAPQTSIDEIVAAIESHQVRVQAVYSSNRDLDFLPLRANKGNALSWLASQSGVHHQDVVVAGDSGNDASMYQVAGVRGIVVANAEAALVHAAGSERVYHCAKRCAAGVIEGMTYLLERSPS